jgi:DNA-binding NtrC family response regulator
MAEQLTTDRLLVVEDETTARETTKTFLEDAGFEVVTAEDGQQALHRLNDGVSVIITDLAMGGFDGMQLLKAVRERAPFTPVIIVTGKGSEQAAVEALKNGAFHYLTKPINPDELLHLVKQATEKCKLSRQVAELHQQLNQRSRLEDMIGSSGSMRQVFEKIKMAADTRSTVLIEGESGTGKELVSRALHSCSARKKGPFIAVNCAAIPKDLIESELFGHMKGTFTGANTERVGKFLAADKGSLLIDEIGELHLDLQSKLLRVIETQKITPLGSNEEKTSNVRIITSTNRELSKLVEEGKFREDLYYRLNVIKISLPPLRERKEDIPLLTRAFIEQIAEENNRPAQDISPDALVQLQSYDWPGNVRQLRNVLESIIVMSSRETIDVADLPEPIREKEATPPLQTLLEKDLPLAEIEKEAIRRALARTGGNRSEASKLLGISARTLQRRIKEYELQQ